MELIYPWILDAPPIKVKMDFYIVKEDFSIQMYMHCLFSGFLPPSGGTAIVNGYDIREDIASVRSSLGLCPQHDVLFDTMTVEEHLIFFAKVWIDVYHEIFMMFF